MSIPVKGSNLIVRRNTTMDIITISDVVGYSDVIFNILDVPELIKALQEISGKQPHNRSDYCFKTGV